MRTGSHAPALFPTRKRGAATAAALLLAKLLLLLRGPWAVA